MLNPRTILWTPSLSTRVNSLQSRDIVRKRIGHREKLCETEFRGLRGMAISNVLNPVDLVVFWFSPRPPCLCVNEEVQTIFVEGRGRKYRWVTWTLRLSIIILSPLCVQPAGIP